MSGDANSGVAKPGGNNMNKRDGKHSGMPETLETAAEEIKSIAAAAIAKTLATTGSPEPSTVVITTTEAGTPATAETDSTAGTHVRRRTALWDQPGKICTFCKFLNAKILDNRMPRRQIIKY
jgi:hypothetical protein